MKKLLIIPLMLGLAACADAHNEHVTEICLDALDGLERDDAATYGPLTMECRERIFALESDAQQAIAQEYRNLPRPVRYNPETYDGAE